MRSCWFEILCIVIMRRSNLLLLLTEFVYFLCMTCWNSLFFVLNYFIYLIQYCTINNNCHLSYQPACYFQKIFLPNFRFSVCLFYNSASIITRAFFFLSHIVPCFIARWTIAKAGIKLSCLYFLIKLISTLILWCF